jgi:putative phage-type endonuclease
LDIFKKKTNQVPLLNDTNEAIEHGVKYEPVLLKFYERIKKTPVYPIGLVQHNKHPWLAASPDGILEDGTLIEGKCPLYRRLNGRIPKNYWIQMQIQMECANRPKCDYVECRIVEYKNELEYTLDDITPKDRKGVLNYKGRRYYWRIEDYMIRTVYRNHEWFETIRPSLENFWEQVTEYNENERMDGQDFQRHVRGLPMTTPSEPEYKDGRSDEYKKKLRSATRLRDIEASRDWDQWVLPHDLRNYILQDPLIDWLDMYGEDAGYTPDEKMPGYIEMIDFKKFIMEKGSDFKSEIVHLLKEQFGSEFIQVAYKKNDIRSISRYHETLREMKKGRAVIFKGVLHDEESQLYSSPDLLVRSDKLGELFQTNPISNEEAIVSAPDLKLYSTTRRGPPYHYCLVSIHYSNLSLCSDGRHLLNSESQPMYKAEAIFSNRILAKMQGYTPPDAYVLGRKWSYAKQGEKYRGYSCFERAGVISPDGYDKKYADMVSLGTQWIRDLRTDGHSWTVAPEASVLELLPNMSSAVTHNWKEAKKQIARDTNEITSIWNCGIKARNTAAEQGVFSWDDPNCTATLLGFKEGTKRHNIVTQLLKVNQINKETVLKHHPSTTMKLRPRKIKATGVKTPRPKNPVVLPESLSPEASSVLRKTQKDLEFFVDFETVGNLNDDFGKLPYPNASSMIYMVGCGWYDPDDEYADIDGWAFRSFTVDHATVDEEARILREWVALMEDLKQKFGTSYPRVYHWSHAEKTFFNRANNRHRVVTEHNHPNWFDLLEVFHEEPITIAGSFDFRLKHVSRALHKHGLIKSEWPNGAIDGMGASVAAWTVSNSTNKPLPETTVIKSIIDYNEIDCRVLWEILDYLRKNH